MGLTLEEIREAVRDLGLCDRPVLVHASLRSFGHVDGGAKTVIGAFLAEGCTLMVPTFSYAFAVPPCPGLCPPMNGWDYEAFTVSTAGTDRVFTPTSMEIDRDSMGAIPTTVLRMPGHVRGDHPLNSFTAVGPLAEWLIASQAVLDVYAPLTALAESHGAVALMGVGLERMTLLHLAEHRAGRRPFIRWANGRTGRPIAVAVGGCSDGFGRFDPILAPIEGTHRVGESTWRVFPVAELLEIAAQAMRENPRITHCGDGGCHRCNDALRGGPIWPIPEAGTPG